jgi:hypothetical protein
MGRTAHDADRPGVDHEHVMDERGVLHIVEADLSESWVGDWALSGVEAIEEYLEKHAAFLDYLEDATA